MKTAILATGLAILAGPVLADPPTSEQVKRIDAICAKTACRAGGYEVAVGVDAAHYTNVPVSRSPYVTEDGEILIFPGETLALQFAINGDTLSAPRFIARYATPKDLALKVDTGLKLVDDPLNSRSPPLPEKGGDTDMSAFPPNTLLISYGQLADHIGMAMDLETNVLRPLKLDTEMSLIKNGAYEWHYTSTCPITSGHSSYESWPSERGPMKLSHFRFIPETVKVTCE